MLIPAGLRSLSLMGSQMRNVPPALAAAAQLTFLGLTGECMRLEASDVEALARLPSLRHFNVLRKANDEPAFWEELAARLPACRLSFEAVLLTVE